MTPQSKFGAAWTALVAALALHVADEALTGFLAVYNPTVAAIRARLPWLPIPQFTFGIWIAGLAAGILLLFALSPLAFRGKRWIVIAAWPLGILMALNGLQHMAVSVYMGRFMPGVFSSPILLPVSLWLLWEAAHTSRQVRPA